MNKMEFLQGIIPCRLKIWQDAKPDEIYTVVFCDKKGRQIILKTNTNDSGIAVVTCYHYLKSVASTCEYRAVSVQYPGESDSELISEASNILLAHLDDDNGILVAAFISLFNTDSTATDPEEIERELKKAQESYCAQDCRTVDDIKTVYNYIWTCRFIEATGMDFSVANKLKEIRNSMDPHQLLIWGVLFCLWGGYDGKTPYSLFKAIMEDAFTLHLISSANKGFVHDLFLV